ncbi:MAG TPA: penicillin-insensitive murein endopeptidase [Nannocystaceae bacterium]|nr:penicillin-insensitive murein endopeptidase [Nannocystaceae bacterium]
MRLRSLAVLLPFAGLLAAGSLVQETPSSGMRGVLAAGMAGSLAPIGLARAGDAAVAEPTPTTDAPSTAMLHALVGPAATDEAPSALSLDRAGMDVKEASPSTNAIDELDVVRWTVDERSSVAVVAGNWGMWPVDLRELNPELGDREWIEAGTQLVVHRANPHKPTLSCGRPNKGHLVEGIPLPEGDDWKIRVHRPRVFGSRTTIESLLTAMRSYAAADPDAPEVRLGEISRRRGGRSNPHVSHRSGRDVDIGYVMRPSVQDSKNWWRTATPKNIDALRTWKLMKALIATGEVQQIFMSAKLQRVVAREAAKELPADEVERMFSATNFDPKVHTIVRHEHGHRDHFHVRFACEDGNIRCRKS